jgi:hypothetical protein
MRESKRAAKFASDITLVASLASCGATFYKMISRESNWERYLWKLPKGIAFTTGCSLFSKHSSLPFQVECLVQFRLNQSPLTTEGIASCLFAFSNKNAIDANTALEQSSWWSQIKPFIYASYITCSFYFRAD